MRATLIALDLDGTIDTDPGLYQQIMSALQAAGCTVVVLTGAAGNTVGPDDLTAKAQCLANLDVTAWDQLVVCSNPLDEVKADWLKANGAALLVDNNKDNAKAAADVCPVLVPWQTRE